MDNALIIYGIFAVLAAIEVFYALRTQQVALPIFGKRWKIMQGRATYWGLVVFWASFVGAFLFHLVTS